MSFLESKIKGSIPVGRGDGVGILPVGTDGDVLTADSAQPLGVKFAPAGAGSDIYAATRVVSLVAGEGTDLTIAAAIAALPAEGGRIFVKQGTYSLAATNTLPDKSVDIVGAGDGTVLDLGANAISAFTIPDTLTARRSYKFSNMKVIGTQTPASAAFGFNDTFASAGTIVGSNLLGTGSNVGATKEVGEPNHGGNAGGASIWVKWVAPATGRVVVHTHGSSFDTLLGVYTGATVSTLTPVSMIYDGSDDDLGQNPVDGTSKIVFRATSGTTYFIAVDGFGGATGNVQLRLIQAAVSNSILDIQDSQFFAVTVIDKVNTSGIKTGVMVTGGGFLPPEQVRVDIQDCDWVPIELGNGSVASNNSDALFTCRNLNFTDPTNTAVGGALNDDGFSTSNFSLHDCAISYTTEDGLQTLYAERSRITNYEGQGAQTNPNSIFIGGLGFDPDNLHQISGFYNCNVVGMTWEFEEEATSYGGYWDSTLVAGASATNGKVTFDGIIFRCAASVPAFPHFGTDPVTYFRSGSEVDITNCRFTNPGGLVNRYIEATDSFYIAWCAFASMAAGANNCGIHVTGPNNIIIGNDFDSKWDAPPIKEEGTLAAVNGNNYSDNIGLTGNGGTDSVWVGPSTVSPSTFNGSAGFNASGTTTDALVTIKLTLSGLGTSDTGLRINPMGLIGHGTIKNTGANSMDVKETVTDLFGVTDSVTTTVTAGNDLLLSMAVNMNTARPPYSSYKIEVKSTSAGNATTYSYRHTMNSEVTW